MSANVRPASKYIESAEVVILTIFSTLTGSIDGATGDLSSHPVMKAANMRTTTAISNVFFFIANPIIV
jgi:hypothetical protein